MKGKWNVISGPKFFKSLLNTKVIDIQFKDDHKEIILKYEIEENGKKKWRTILGRAHDKYKGRYHIKFAESWWQKWIEWDLRFLKIDYQGHMVIGSRNRYLFGLFEVNFGWILSRDKNISEDDF